MIYKTAYWLGKKIVSDPIKKDVLPTGSFILDIDDKNAHKILVTIGNPSSGWVDLIIFFNYKS